jgi:hypothetical protein
MRKSVIIELGLALKRRDFLNLPQPLGRTRKGDRIRIDDHLQLHVIRKRSAHKEGAITILGIEICADRFKGAHVSALSIDIGTRRFRYRTPPRSDIGSVYPSRNLC